MQGQARVGGGRKMMGKIDFSCGNRSWTVGEGWQIERERQSETGSGVFSARGF